MIYYTSKPPYNIKGDNKTDNGPGFKKLQADMATSKEKSIAFLPSGIILSSFTRWTYKVNSFKVIGDRTTLKSLYKGDDEAQQRGLFAGEMMQTNVDTYNGKKEYVTPVEILTARAGGRVIILKKPIKYKIGEKVFIRSGDLFAGGYPRACRNFEWNEVAGFGLGTDVFLKMPLAENHFEYDTAEVFSLDEVNYCELAEFEGITFEGNFATQPSMNFRATNCEFKKWLWLTECKNIFIKDCYAEKVEVDKLFLNAFIDGLVTPSSPSNGSGRNIEVINSHTGSLRLCPRYLTYDNNTVWADEVIKDEEKQLFDYAIPCIANAPAENPVRRLTLNRQSFTSSSRSQADSNLEFAPFEEITI